jgi:hypothetical protein
MHQAFQQLARRTGTSLNEAIVAALRQSLTRPEASNTEPNPVYQRQVIELALRGLLAELPMSRLSVEEDRNVTRTSREEIPLLTPPLSATILEERSDRF